MNSNNAVLRSDEEFVLGLRRLYESFGYKKFIMSKFEKYDLYLENKSFLRNANIITVTDPKGRLLALKPDITISIVKNVRKDDIPVKLYYNEKVYNSDSEAGEIKESTQVGLEYIGDLDVRGMAEILLLAAESLANADDQYRIAVSHMGFVSEILDNSGLCENSRELVTKYISEKNLHGLRALCESLSVSFEVYDRLAGLITVCGTLSEVVATAEKLVCGDSSRESYNELVAISEILSSFGMSDKFILDFSVINDMNYYNGLVFQGFINGVPKTVLSGGRYDKLINRFGIDASAAGFAVSIDLLNNFMYQPKEYDYDVLLIYSENADPASVLLAQREIIASGQRCIALSKEPENCKYKTKALLSEDGSLRYE